MKHIFIRTLFTAIFVVVIAFNVLGQQDDQELKNKIITLEMDKQPLGKVFEQLIVKYDVPIGFEESVLDRGHNDYEFETNIPYANKKTIKSIDGNITIDIESSRGFQVKENWITVNAQNQKLEAVLDTIVKQMHHYKWEIKDGVVNIFPIQGRDEVFKEFLDLNISKFDLINSDNPSAKANTVFRIRSNVFQLPEVVSFLERNGIFYSKVVRESNFNLGRKIQGDFNFKDLSLKDLLNRITKIKRGGWILKKSDMYNSLAQATIEISI